MGNSEMYPVWAGESVFRWSLAALFLLAAYGIGRRKEIARNRDVGVLLWGGWTVLFLMLLGFFIRRDAAVYPNISYAFDYDWQGLLFFLMLGNVLYLWLDRNRLKRRSDAGILLFLWLVSTLFLILDGKIWVVGFGWSMWTESVYTQTFLGLLGKYTFLTVTPVLYVGVVVLCVKIALAQPADEKV